MVTRRLPVISRIEGGWVRINDALSKHEQRRRRRNKPSRERDRGDGDLSRRPHNEKFTIDLVA